MVFDGADGIGAVFLGLFEAKLLVGESLQFVECDADDADWTRKLLEKLPCEPGDVMVAMESFFCDKLAMRITVIEIVSPDIDAACIEIFATETITDILGEMNKACLCLCAREVATVEDELPADAFYVARDIVNLDTTKAAVPFAAVFALADEFYESCFVGIKKL